MTRIALMCIIACQIVSGCGRDDSSSNAQPVPGVQVIDDAAQVEAARKQYMQQRAKRFDELLANPGWIRSFEEYDVALLNERRGEAVAALAKVRDDEAAPAVQRVEAMLALRVLGEPLDFDRAAALARQSPDAQFELLANLNDFGLPPDEQPLPQSIRTLIVGAIDSSEERLARLAASAAGHRKIEEAADRIVHGLKTRPSDYLLAPAAELRPTREVIDLIVAQLRKVGDDRGGMFAGSSQAADALAVAAKKTTDPDARRIAIDALLNHLRDLPDQPWIDSGTIGEIAAIAESPKPDAIAALSDLVRRAKWGAVRKRALRELAEIDPPLAKTLSTETGIAPASDDRPAPAPGSAATSRPTTQQAAAALARHGVLEQSELARASAMSSADDYEPEDEIRAALSNVDRYYAFDAETGTVPNRHDLLIIELAAHSAGRFKPEAVLETYEEPSEGASDREEGKYLVQFIYGGRLYRFQPRDMGDWYDVEAVLVALNRAVADAGLAERFMPLASGDQIAEIVFARPDAFSAAATELGLKLSDDPDEARKSGKAFEDKMLEQMEGQVR